MKIYSMTATFGKLEQKTLTLQPGLNVITAPNEWGKSTWCAFLSAMLYGLDTRAKSTKNNLADKEHYAPWSGSPMSGRIDLNWNGRDITIQRHTRKRQPLGEFRAYETASGLEIPELTAENCGQMLLGVERSVFLRTVFIRFQDLTVTDDEALRRRLNNLVTSGDESGDGDRLAGQLKALRTRIRYHRTGLLPQLEAQRDTLAEKLLEWDTLHEEANRTQKQLDEAEDWYRALENHAQTLAYRDFLRDQEAVDRARQTHEKTLAEFEQLSARCSGLPTRETAAAQLESLNTLLTSLHEAENALTSLPEIGAPEPLAAQFTGLSGPEAEEKVRQDQKVLEKARGAHLFSYLPGIAAAILGCFLLPRLKIPGVVCLCLGLLLLIAAGVAWLHRKNICRKLTAFYGSADPGHWEIMVRQYADQLYLHSASAESIRKARQDGELRLQTLRRKLMTVTGNRSPGQCRSHWEAVLALWDRRDSVSRSLRQQEAHFKTLTSLLRPVQPPQSPDKLTQDAAETARLLEECGRDRGHLAHLLGQHQGKLDALGSRDALQRQLQQKNTRILQLEKTYQALTIALETLSEAGEELQRRFAPRITARTRELMQRMTDGRYDKLTLSRDLCLQTGARQEDILRSALWRSDGTVDQLYLALRLAVSEALLPESPLILDDALIRFDEKRLTAVLDILKEIGRSRQVILFTCQNRESRIINSDGEV